MQRYRVITNHGLETVDGEFFHYFPVGTIVVRSGSYDDSDIFGRVYDYTNEHEVYDIAGDFHDVGDFSQYIPDAYLEAL